LAHRIVGDRFVSPASSDSRIARNAELRNKSSADPEKARVIEETGAHEIEKAIHAERRPFAMRFDNEIAFAGLKLRLKNCRRGLFPEGRTWIAQGRLDVVLRRQFVRRSRGQVRPKKEPECGLKKLVYLHGSRRNPLDSVDIKPESEGECQRGRNEVLACRGRVCQI
jgi:hypothetical protein